MLAWNGKTANWEVCASILGCVGRVAKMEERVGEIPHNGFLVGVRQVLILPCVLSSVDRHGPGEVIVEKPPGQMDAADDMQ